MRQQNFALGTRLFAVRDGAGIKQTGANARQRQADRLAVSRQVTRMTQVNRRP